MIGKDLPLETWVGLFYSLINNYVQLDEATKKVLIKKQHLQKLLRDNVVALSFVKKSTGFRRQMLCTINRQFLRDYAEILGYVEPKGRKDMTGTNYIIVWDLEKENWRTINAATTRIIDIMSFDDYLSFVE